MTENPLRPLEETVLHGVIPPELRLFLPTATKYVYINNGSTNIHWSEFGIMSNLKAERGILLDAFAKFEFVIVEMLRFAVVGFEPTNAILEVIKVISARQRVNILEKIKVIDKELADKLRNIVDVRNALAHKFSTSEVIWNDKPLFNVVYFPKFSSYVQDTWNEMIETYNEMINLSDVQGIIDKIIKFRESIPETSSASQDNNQQGSELQS